MKHTSDRRKQQWPAESAGPLDIQFGQWSREDLHEFRIQYKSREDVFISQRNAASTATATQHRRPPRQQPLLVIGGSHRSSSPSPSSPVRSSIPPVVDTTAIASLTLSPTVSLTSPKTGPSTQPKPSSWAALFQKSSPQSSAVTVSTSTKNSPHTVTLRDVAKEFRIQPHQKPLLLRGLINRGNMCFMNSILYPLLYCAPLFNLLRLIARQIPHTFHSKTPLIDALIMFVEEFPEVAPRKPGELVHGGDLVVGDSFVPEYVYDALQADQRFMSVKGRQEDAEEFLGFLLDGLHEEFLHNGAPISLPSASATSTVGSPRTPYTNEQPWTEVGPRHKTSITRNVAVEESPITKIFFGQLRSILRCPGRKDSITVEPFHTLQLDISPDNVLHITDALLEMIKPEVLEGYTKPDSNQLVEATKQLLLERLPPILILHLKRFVFDGTQTRKVHKFVKFEEDLRIPREMFAPSQKMQLAVGEDVRYRLIGVVNHHGVNAADGHYTSHVRRSAKEWIRVDDTQIERTSGKQVTAPPADGSSAYLLFYQRQP